jgi:P4 family phage/plasmid primase-like protien
VRLEGAVLVMTAPDTTLAPPPVQPDAGMIATFMDAVFGYCEGFVPIRALAEKGGPDRPPHTPFIASDGELGAKTAMQAAWAADAGMALYAVPGTVARPGEARAEDVAQTQVVLVDLDHGDIGAKREHLIRHLGEPCLEVASGGVTAEGQAKRHLYWRLTEPAEGEDIARVCRLRHIIAVKAGGDPAFRSPHQPIRIAGSVYHKSGTPRLVRIIGQRARDHDLAELAEAVMAMPPREGTAASVSDLDFNDAGTGSIEDIFVQRVREGGADGITRFEAISKVIGYWIRRARDGHVTPAGAWDEIVAYNEARVDPPWPLDRLQAEAERLWKRDRENNGAIAAEGGADDGGNDGVVLPVGFTEDALALEFTGRHGDDWRYVAGWGQWLVWCGTHWQKETTLRAYDLARLVCRDAARRCNNRKVSTKLSTAATVSAVERLARADRRHAATTEEWDRDLWALNTPGGVIDLRSGAGRPHDRAECITKISTSTPKGECPTWRAFLATVTGGDPELQAYLARMAGYALTGVTSEHALFFLYGTGANGKSVFVNTLAAILGDYATNAPMDTFMVAQGERHPTDVAGLRGARLVTSIETEQGRRWAESKLKALTGGDKISARFMRQDFFEFTPQFKLVVAGNHKPAIRNVDIAMRRRLHMVPFTVTIPDHKRDQALPQKLLAERDGILAWAVAGCLEWQRSGLKPPVSVVAATEEYFEAEDALGRWLDECCRRTINGFETTADLFAAWKTWADGAGEFVGSQKRFSENLSARNFDKGREPGTGRQGFLGLSLNDAARRTFSEGIY